MTVRDGTFRANEEVDEIRWEPLADAGRQLSYAGDRAILDAVEPALRTLVFLVRHARAGDRERWTGDDRLRPLDGKGRRQADAMVAPLAGYPITRLVSSPYLRCVQTLEPLSARLDAPGRARSGPRRGGVGGRRARPHRGARSGARRPLHARRRHGSPGRRGRAEEEGRHLAPDPGRRRRPARPLLAAARLKGQSGVRPCFDFHAVRRLGARRRGRKAKSGPDPDQAASARGRMDASASTRRPARRQKAGVRQPLGDDLGTPVVTEAEAAAPVVEHRHVGDDARAESAQLARLAREAGRRSG